MSIINNSQIVGSLGKDLVLNTLGKIYVRVGDRYYELDFLNKINTTDTSVGGITDATESIESNVLVLNSISGIQYPGDNKLIVLTDGKFYVTKNGRYKNITPTTQSSATPQATITAITDSTVIGRLYSNNLILDFTSGDVTANTIKVKKIIADQISIKQNSEIDNYFVSGSGKLYIGPEVPIINIDVQGEYVTFDIKSIPDVSLFPINEIVTDEHESFLGQIVDVSTSTLKALILEGDPNDAKKLILKGDFIQYDPKWKSLYNKTYNLRYADISKSGDYSDLEFATVASNVDVILKPGTFIKCLKDCTISVNKSFQYPLQSGTLYLLTDSLLINLTRNLHYFNTLDELYNYSMDSDDIAIIKETEQLYYKGILIGGKAQATLPDNFQIEDAQTGAVLSYDNGIWKPSMKYATYKYIDERFDYLLNNAPSALDTLGEIAEVLQKNINNVGDIIKAITAITNDVNNKVDQTEFYNAVQQINDQINSLDYSKTFKTIYDLLDKKADLELVNTLNTTIQSLKNIVDTKLDITVFETEIEKLKKQLGTTNLEDINKKLDSLAIQLQSKVDVKEFNDLSQKLSDLRQIISNISSTLETKVNTDIFNSEIARLDDHLKKINIDNIIAVLNDKATWSSVKELENKFSDYASIAYVQGLFSSVNLDQYDKKLTELQSADESLLKLINSNQETVLSQIEQLNSSYQSTWEQIEHIQDNYNSLLTRVDSLEVSTNKIGNYPVNISDPQQNQLLVFDTDKWINKTISTSSTSDWSGMFNEESGQLLGTLTINNNEYKIYIPNSSSSSGDYTLLPATENELGGIKIGFNESGKNYAVKLYDEHAYVNVPWTDTTYSVATSDELGLVKIGYQKDEAKQNYPVQLSNGQMYVNVPWTDNNTTYTFTPTNPTLSWGTSTSIGTIGGTIFKVRLPANPNTDTKVTSVGNHYTPSGGSAATLTESGSTLSFGGAVITGITQDAAGHITAVSTSKLPSNPLDGLTELKIGECTILWDESIGGLKFDKGIYSEQYITAGMPGGVSGSIITDWSEVTADSVTDQQLVSAKVLYNDKKYYSQWGNAIGSLQTSVNDLQLRVTALENLHK